MAPGVFEVSSLAGGADSVLFPAQEHRDLAHAEWPGTVLEHLWKTSVVDRWGPLVNLWRIRCYAARMIWLGW